MPECPQLRDPRPQSNSCALWALPRCPLLQLACSLPAYLPTTLRPAGGFNPQFFPTLDSVQALFGRPFTAASFLLHVLAINLIAARSAFIDGKQRRPHGLVCVFSSSIRRTQ